MNTLVTAVSIDGVHSHYLLYRKEAESYVPIYKGTDLELMKELAKEEHLKSVYL